MRHLLWTAEVSKIAILNTITYIKGLWTEYCLTQKSIVILSSCFKSIKFMALFTEAFV